ncbi:MAG: hypothetical protein ACRC62_24255 [Microcoleus sp.]
MLSIGVHLIFDSSVLLQLFQESLGKFGKIGDRLRSPKKNSLKSIGVHLLARCSGQI